MTLRSPGWRAVLCAFALCAAGAALAQDNAVPPPSAPAQRSAGELDQHVQPIVAYPDYLVGMILPASVYPLEVGDAAFQLGQTNVAVDISAQSWDPSIKSLAQFPAVVQWLDRNLPWTVELGRAFVAQPKDVLDAIQRVRLLAYAAGTLKSDAVQIVTKTATASGKEIITIVPVMAATTGASPAATTPSATTGAVATSGTTPVGTTSSAAYAPPPAYTAPASSSNAKSAAGLVVGVAVTAAIVNNVDWDEKYVVNTPGGVVIVDEDELEDFQENRSTANPQATSTSTSTASAQSSSTAKTAGKASTQPAGKATPSTQTTRQPAPSTQSAATAWQPNPSRMASSGAPQPSTASQSPAARGWSQPSTSAATQPRTSPSTSSQTRGSGLSGLSEGARVHEYSGRGAASRSGGRSGGRSGR